MKLFLLPLLIVATRPLGPDADAVMPAQRWDAPANPPPVTPGASMNQLPPSRSYLTIEQRRAPAAWQKHQQDYANRWAEQLRRRGITNAPAPAAMPRNSVPSNRATNSYSGTTWFGEFSKSKAAKAPDQIDPYGPLAAQRNQLRASHSAVNSGRTPINAVHGRSVNDSTPPEARQTDAYHQQFRRLWAGKLASGNTNAPLATPTARTNLTVTPGR